MSTLLGEIGDQLAAGQALDDVQTEALASSDNLLTIGMLADDARRRIQGDSVSFVRVLEVSLTQKVAPVMVPDTAGEVRIVGTPDSIEVAVTAAQSLTTLVGPLGPPITGFYLSDLELLAEADGVSLRGLLSELRSAGLRSIAEAPADRLRQPEQAFQAVVQANLPVTTVTIHHVAAPDILETFRRVSRWEMLKGYVRAFAPIPRMVESSEPSTGYDDVRQVALARLLVDKIDSIQVDWFMQGTKLVQVALTFGADDVDRVPTDENEDVGVRRVTSVEIRRQIDAASREPVERNGCFEAMTS